MVHTPLPINVRFWRLCLAGLLAALALMVSGCSSWGGPPADVVEQALNLRLQQTQQMIRGTDAVPFSGSQIKINHTEAVTLDGESAYRVEGQFTLKGRYRDRRYRHAQTPFELYLAATGDTWELIQPELAPGGTTRWQHLPIPSDSSPES
ncbi:hypothetical protein C7271_26195 [filamentous cyanobacterium CCP5]|nr:hypothetical protein C7271_26195 [filamentous cyanobacterium CCP5]